MSYAVIYHWRLKPGREPAFRVAWSEATQLIHLHCGSYGARLHEGEPGQLWSYARWPSAQVRSACSAHPEIVSAACFAQMHDCVDERFDEVPLTLIDDQLVEPSVVHPPVNIATQRLALRPLELGDALALHGALCDANTMRWWSRGPHTTMEETVDTIRRNVGSGDVASVAVTLRSDPADALGWVVLMDRKAEVGEVGYLLRPSAQGQGIAREAVSAMVDYGFGPRQLRRIYADTDPDNLASVKLLRALHFREEGRLRGQWKTHMGVRDSLIFGRLADD